MRPGFFLRESLRALRRNAAPSLAAFATILITTLVLGVFIPLVRAATAQTNQVRNKIELGVFTNYHATRGECGDLGRKARASTLVQDIQFSNRAQALQIQPHRL